MERFEFRECVEGKACFHPHGFTVAFHLECFLCWPLTRSICQRAIYNFESPPLPPRTSTLDSIASSLGNKFDMPFEILRLIATYLLPTYSAALSSVESSTQSQTIQIDCSQEIWAYFVKFRGVVYISKISNEVENPIHGQRRVLIYRQVKGDTYNLYIARDGWGIRRIAIQKQGTPVQFKQSNNIWWDMLGWEGETLYGSTDVCLRNI